MSALLMERMKVENKRAKAEGRAEGKAEGRKEGGISMLINLVKQNLLDVADAAKTLGMPVSEFNALLKQ